MENKCMPWDPGFPACYLNKPRQTVGALVAQAILAGAGRGFDLQSANNLKLLSIMQQPQYAELKGLLIDIEANEGFEAYL